MKLWINACEVSGDLQAGILLESLKKSHPNIQAIGMGGNKLEESGQINFFHINELSVMGITEVFSALPRIFRLLSQIKKTILKEKPDAILLVDSAEFNFKIAKFAYKHNIPVYYFIPPKVWAWRQSRLKFLKKYVKKIFCILPFEVEFYQKHGIEVSYIQNPLVDFLQPYIEKQERKITPFRIALMPGSRKKEVNSLLPLFAETTAILKEEFPQMKFSIIQAPHFTQEYLEKIWNESDIDYEIPNVDFVQSKDRYTFLRTCEFCIAASGTATLETGLLGLPTIISYRISKLTYFLVHRFVKVKFAGLVNLIFDREVFPEFIQDNAKAELLARQIKEWIYKTEKIEKVYKDLEELQIKVSSNNTNIRIFEENKS